uniref:Mannose-P-dolichol utilization defect 1 protein homolog n=1 Tax=Culicoides sonorensis TaxID=179676 RepID=A0A336LMD6_CULSO
MTNILKKGLLSLMSQECYDNYFIDLNFLDVPCFKALLSKGLGLGIIAGSVLVKVPQIVKIWHAKSAEGINLFSVLLDLFAITCHMAYSYVSGFPFSAWGDTSFLAIQTALIAALVLFFSDQKGTAGLFSVVYCSICYILMAGFTPRELLWSAQGLNIPILLIGKLSQAVTNYKNGSTGQLSAITCFMLFFGSLARIFTSVQETGDSMMIITYLASSFANSVIVLQLMYYWNADKSTKSKEQIKIGDKKQKQKSKKAD